MDRVTAIAAVDSKWCGIGLERNPYYQRLASHMQLADGISTNAQLADNSYPDLQSARILYAWHQDLGVCRRIAMHAMHSAVPVAVPAVQEGYAISDASLEALKQGRITYAEANRVRDEVALTLEQQVNSALQAKRMELAALDNDAWATFVGDMLGAILVNAPDVMGSIRTDHPVRHGRPKVPLKP
jgi:hypothetical protein